MATWTRQTVLTQEYAHNVVFDGVSKLYYAGANFADTSPPLYAGNRDIYEYDLLTDTETLIVNNTSFSELHSIAYFDGNLYFLDQQASQPNFPDTHVVVTVYRWTGVVDGLATAHTVVDVDGDYIACNVCRLYADDSQILAIAINDPNFGLPIQEIHADSGGGWGAGSLPFTVLPTSLGNRNNYDTANPAGIYDFLRDNSDGEWKAVKASGSSFALYQGNLPAEAGQLIGTDPAGAIHWVTYLDSTYYLNLAMSAATEGSPAIPAVLQINMPYSCGLYDPGTGGMDFYSTNDGNWTLVENVQEAPFGPLMEPQEVWFVRASNDDVFLIGRNSTTAATEVWKRSEAIPDPSTIAKFYFGQNIPAYRSDLPFSGVNPGGMAVSPAGNVVVLGGNEAGAETAAYGNHPFTAWTDMSDGMTTGTPVTSIKYV